jgi:hypothetical protein
MWYTQKKFSGISVSFASMPVIQAYQREPVFARLWWRRENDAEMVIGEYIKLTIYFLTK